MLLASSIYWSALITAAIAGVALLIATLRRRRGWWWKLPLACVLIAGPYLADVVRCRLAEGESIVSAGIPTSLLLHLMEPDTHWPYGSVFARLHRAPARHAMWDWQLAQLADWCGRCIPSADPAMVKRGVQIAATLAGKGCDDAIDPLAAALLVNHPEAAGIACDALASLGRRTERARAALEAAVASAPSPAIRERAAAILTALQSLKNKGFSSRPEPPMTILERESIDLPTPAGPMRTYIYRPNPGSAPGSAPGRFPGILFYSEIFQVTGPIGRTAAYLAGHGFIVAVPEIYHEFEPPGTVLPYDQPGADRGNQLKTTKELASYDADSQAVLDHLAARPDCTGRLGTMGICLGGHLAFRAALNPQVLAAACFYATDLHKRGLGIGTNDDTLARCGQITGEMMMVWGRQDPHITREGRAQIYNAMADANLNFTWHEFNAQHAFLRDEGHRYDPALARLTLGMALDLFQRLK